MRIIAGSARGTRLTVPRGTDVRPTSDRARETLFNVLTPLLQRRAALDLFAGCGGLGIEALSRGVGHATLVERHRRTASALRANLERCHLQARARVLGLAVRSALRRLSQEGAAFDLVFADPPYDSDQGVAALVQIAALGLAAPASIAVLEHRRDRLATVSAEGWRELRRLTVGHTGFVILEYVTEPPAC